MEFLKNISQRAIINFAILTIIIIALVAGFFLKDQFARLYTPRTEPTLNIVEAINKAEDKIRTSKWFIDNDGKELKLLITPEYATSTDTWGVTHTFSAKSAYEENLRFPAKVITTITGNKITECKYIGEENILTARHLFEQYIRANISSVSPIKEVLGGKFHITNIAFKDDNNTILRYEDGHISIKANVQFELDSDRKIKIIKFDAKEQ